MKLELATPGSWRHDLTHCLHTTMGVLLRHHGLDPLVVLGAAWNFHYRPGDIRREEYYFPCSGDSLLGSLAPYHPVSSIWHQPSGPDEGWSEVRAALLAGSPVAVAADNFHLPFRPAYRDVHTNHLLTVFGFDDGTGEVFVDDPVPPRFCGAITRAKLTAARDSANPVLHERDLFFTANPIGNRWLSVHIGSDWPVFDPDFVRHLVRGNMAGFAGSSDDGALDGLDGQRRFLADSVARLHRDPAVVDELFVVAGAVLAMTGLHADLLYRAGRQFHRPDWCELSREVDRVAHHWTALRIAVATARQDPGAAAESVARRTEQLMADQTRILDRMAAV